MLLAICHTYQWGSRKVWLHRSVGARYLDYLETSKGVTNVPFFDLRRQYLPLREDILSEIAALCDQQNFILGAQVEELEQKIAALAGTAYGIGTSSGTDAQLMTLMSLSIGPGDAVLTTPFTFFSTAGCISRVGATPIFIDIDPDTFALSPQRLEEFLVKRCVSTSTGVKTIDGKRVCAVVPVHLFGLCGDMHSIMQLAARWNLPVIEDAALLAMRAWWLPTIRDWPKTFASYEITGWNRSIITAKSAAISG